MKDKPKNTKEFIVLMNRYETITLEEIKEAWENSYVKRGHDVAQSLTGFGGSSTCTLCLAVKEDCSKCVYGRSERGWYGCLDKPHDKTYHNIDHTKTPLQLRNALRKRAKHMKEYYKHLFV